MHNEHRVKLKFFFLIVTLVTITSIQCKNEVLVKSCPTDQSSWNTAARRKECHLEAGRGYSYHCLQNEQKQLVEACLVPSWIESGICPILYASGDFGSEICTPRMNQNCPATNYRSNSLYLYPICVKMTLPAKNITANTTNGDEKRDNSFGNVKQRMVGLRYAPAVSALSAALFSFMSFWILYLYYKKKYNDQKDIDPEKKYEEERIRFTKNSEYSCYQVPVVELEAYGKGLHILEETGILIITGRIGSGKTTAMEQISSAMVNRNKDWSTKDMSCFENKIGIEEHRKDKRIKEKTIITWDDCFGKLICNPMHRENIEQKVTNLLSRVNERVNEQKIVITMHEREFSEIGVHLNLQNKNIEKCILHLDTLVTTEAPGILKSMFLDPRFDSQMKDDIESSLFNTSKDSAAYSFLGLPLICRLVSIPEIFQNFKLFLKNPLQCIFHIFENMKNNNEQLYCTMIFACSKGGNICELRTDNNGRSMKFIRTIGGILAPSMLPPVSASNNINERRKLMSEHEEAGFLRKKLEGICIQAPNYFLRIAEEKFKFQHSFLALGLICHFYKSFPELAIKFLDLDILTELLRPKSYNFNYSEHDVHHMCMFKQRFEKSPNHSSVKSSKAKAKSCNKENDDTKDSWKFVLEEKHFPLFIQRIQEEGKETIFKEHPLFSDKDFCEEYKTQTTKVEKKN